MIRERESRSSYKHATRQPQQPGEATQQPTVVKASQGYHSKALSRFQKQVDCRFCILVLKEVWRRQVKWAVSSCWKHRQHGRHLRNNKPSNESFEGRNRKRLPRFTSWIIVAFVYFYWKQIHGINWKTTVSPSITQMRLTQQQANRSAIQGNHSKALITHYNRVNCCFGILIKKEDNQQ